MKINSQNGFTLIELLVVIAIIALLTGIIVTNLVGSRSKARDAKRVSDIGQIQVALELYFDRCKQYPPILVTGANTGCPPGAGISFGSYISVVPSTPGIPGEPAKYDYAFDFSSRADYILHTKLENYNDVLKDSLPSIPGTITASFTCTDPKTSLDYCVGPK